MSPIEIDPKTGAPIVVGEKPVSDFVAQVQEHLDEKKPDETPVSTIPASGPGNPAPQHQHLIESAIKSNAELAGTVIPPKPLPPVEQLPTTRTPPPMRTHASSAVRVATAKEREALNPVVPPVVNNALMQKIRNVLRDNGMDSQQQEQALQRIGLILAGKE